MSPLGEPAVVDRSRSTSKALRPGLVIAVLIATVILIPANGKSAHADLASDYYYCTSKAFDERINDLWDDYDTAVAEGELHQAAATRMSISALERQCRQIINQYENEADKDQESSTGSPTRSSPGNDSDLPDVYPRDGVTSGPTLESEPLNQYPRLITAVSRPERVELSDREPFVRLTITFEDAEQPTSGWVTMSNGDQDLRSTFTFNSGADAHRATALMRLPRSDRFAGRWEPTQLILNDDRGGRAPLPIESLDGLAFTAIEGKEAVNTVAEEPDTFPPLGPVPEPASQLPIILAALAAAVLAVIGFTVLARTVTRRGANSHLVQSE